MAGDFTELVLDSPLQDMTFAAIATYAAILEDGPLRIPEIADRTPVSRSRVTDVSRTLVAAGLIERVYSGDARSPAFRLTDRAKSRSKAADKYPADRQ